MVVAVATTNIWLVRDTRRARMGSLILVATSPTPSSRPAGRSPGNAPSSSFSTDRTAGVVGVMGVLGGSSSPSSRGRDDVESTRTARSCSGDAGAEASGFGEASWETWTEAGATLLLLLVAYVFGVPTGQYMAARGAPWSGQWELGWTKSRAGRSGRRRGTRAAAEGESRRPLRAIGALGGAGMSRAWRTCEV